MPRAANATRVLVLLRRAADRGAVVFLTTDDETAGEYADDVVVLD